jgi:hypothetical protein
MLIKKVLALLALMFGLLGVLACVAGIYAVWRLKSRLDHANEKVFTALDKGLTHARDRVCAVQKRVQDSKITTSEIVEVLRDWTTRKLQERLTAQAALESRVEKLDGYLQTADAWLETASESIRGAGQVLELSQSLGAPVDPALLVALFEKLTWLRTTIQQTEQTVKQIREFTAVKEDEENRLARLTKLLGRTLVTVGEMDTRLEEAATRLAQMRDSEQQLQARTGKYLLLASIACCLLLVWIAAGQVALCLAGWKN